MAENVMRMIGYSATGKGTRTLALIRYLSEDKKLTPMVFSIKTKDDMKCNFWGLFYKEYNLLIPGNFVKNFNGMYSWQGLDCIKAHATFNKVVAWYRDLLSNNFNVFCEGNLGWHEIYEKDFLNLIKSLKLQLFDYESEEEYVSRIIERSGKACKNTGDYKKCNTVKRRLKELDEKHISNVDIKFSSCQEEVWKCASDYMSSIDPEDGKAIEEKYKNNTELLLRKNGEHDTPSQKFLKDMFDWARNKDNLKSAEVETIEEVNGVLKNFIVNF